MTKISKRLQLLPDFYLAEIGKEISSIEARGGEVIRLDIGSPDLPPHPSIIETLSSVALNKKAHGYQPHSGPEKLRKAWATYYHKNYSVDIDPKINVVPTIGSKGGIFHFSQAFVNPGDYVLIANPGYTTYERSTLFAGGIPYSLDLHPEHGYLPQLNSIPDEIARKSKIMWLNYPNNPTSTVATLEFFAEVIAYAKQHDIIVCHDAPYAQIYFDEKPPSILQVPGAIDVAIEFNSLSKSHNMAGWRVGAAVGNSELLKGLAALKVNTDSGYFLPIIEATVTALSLDERWIHQRNDIYRERRDLVTDRLKVGGFSFVIPEASFYVWFQIPEKLGAIEYAKLLLHEAGVSLSPGTIFGTNGEGYMRISLTKPVEILTVAMDKILSFSRNRKSNR
jgi:LL-diaminopimelate aminotransferase